jgi:NAD+ synthase (glutamine-hydrolysing)
MKVVAAQINPTIGDIAGNKSLIFTALDRARQADADIVLFPELSLCGYPPEDLLLDSRFIDALERQCQEIASATRGLMAVIGTPRWNPSRVGKPLFNSAAVFQNGELLGFHDKQLLPTYDVFDETRFFQPGETVSIFQHQGKKVAVTICEDLWQHSHGVRYTNYQPDPVKWLQKEEIDLALNLSASPYSQQQTKARLHVFSQAAKALQAPLIVCNQAGANDQLIFDGHSFYLNAQGQLLRMGRGFAPDDLQVALDMRYEVRATGEEERVADLHQALVMGIRDYFRKQQFKKAVLGLSGGIDSALVACLAVEALGADNVLALNLPSRFSSPESKSDAQALASHLGMQLHAISIEPMFEAALQTVHPFFVQCSQDTAWDTTEENLQARIRGQILMAFTNKFGSLLLSTGNKSEMAMGYMTIYGDMCGALAPLADVTKSKVYELAFYLNRNTEIIPSSILKKQPSPELKANQTYLDTLPAYEILDPIIEDYIEKRLSPEEIAEKQHQPLPFINQLIVRMHQAEYKRRQAPMGLRVTDKAFSKGRYVPIVQKWFYN